MVASMPEPHILFSVVQRVPLSSPAPNAPAVRRWPRLMIDIASTINGISDRIMPILVAEVRAAA